MTSVADNNHTGLDEVKERVMAHDGCRLHVKVPALLLFRALFQRLNHRQPKLLRPWDFSLTQQLPGIAVSIALEKKNIYILIIITTAQHHSHHINYHYSTTTQPSSINVVTTTCLSVVSTLPMSSWLPSLSMSKTSIRMGRS